MIAALYVAMFVSTSVGLVGFIDQGVYLTILNIDFRSFLFLSSSTLIAFHPLRGYPVSSFL